MPDLHAAGKAVYVRLSSRLGHVLGLSENPAHATSDEPVYHVKYDDDGTTVHAGHSSLGEPEEAEAAAPVAVEVLPVAEESAKEPANG
jgi:hypothetical protein